MSIWTKFADRERKAELRESKDEMMVGEVVRVMARRGWPAVKFWCNNDYQRVRFKTLQDPTLYSIYITLDRKTGTGALGQALFGSKATLAVTCEVRNFVADPDDLVEMYKTDFANLFKLSWKGVKINHEYNAIHGTTREVIEIDQYINQGPQGIQALSALLNARIDMVREKLEPFHKAGLPSDV